MQLFEGYTAEELDRVLTISRVLAAILAILTACAIAVNQWVTHRIAQVHREERVLSRQRMAAAEHELLRMRKDVTEVAADFDKLTTERKLTEKQKAALLSALKSGAKGRILVTFLAVEWDAEPYARQIAELFREAGFDTTLSEHIWVEFEHDGEFLVEAGGVSALAGEVIRAFGAAGINLRREVSAAVVKEFSLKEGTLVYVVSNRE